MHKNKNTAARRKRSLPLALVISLVLILCFAVGGTVAYLADQTQEKENVFTPSKVACEVVETFVNGVKSDVKIQNTGDTTAYIRAMIIVTWKDANGNVYWSAPVEKSDYTIDYGSGWTKQGNYWYCNTEVAPGNSTPALITSCSTNVTPPTGYGLSVEIIADAIQSVPDSAVSEAWGYVPRTNEEVQQ